jgi:acetylornithine deacetylase/succinyl-diaminopimelate desuccinylase-like protein
MLPSTCFALCAALLAAVAFPASAQEQDLTRYEAFARDVFRELIDINTTHSVGNTTEAAEAMAARLLAAGFLESDVQVVGGVPNRGNLVARLRGSGSGRPPILVMAHLDVVEADPADWTADPFTFLERDGYFYGRGTTDDKDEAAIYVANLIRMKEEGFVPDRDIIVALTADEEGGPNNGVQWLIENRRDLIEAAYGLNEGGGGAMKNGVRISNNVQASEKIYQSFLFEVTNPGGHSSLPVKDNAIYHLAESMLKVRSHDFPVQLNEVTRAYFEGTAELVDPETAAAMRGILRTPPDPDAVAQLAPFPVYNSRMRTTCVATMLEGGHAENALPQRAQATVNCRILPDASPDDVYQTLVRVAGSDQVAITPEGAGRPSPPSPLTPEVMGAIERVTEQMWPGVPVIPTMSTGATDGAALRRVGIPVYGVSGLFTDVDDVRAHGQDERLSTRSFYEGLEFLYRLVRALSSADVM